MVTSMEKPYVVGMDIGGTNTVFGIVDQRGNVLATDSVKTQSYAKIEDYVEAVSSKLLPLIESVGGVSLFTFMHWRRKWQPTPVFLPGESQGRWGLVGCCLWLHRVGHN